MGGDSEEESCVYCINMVGSVIFTLVPLAGHKSHCQNIQLTDDTKSKRKTQLRHQIARNSKCEVCVSPVQI